jgi:protein CpxP
MKLRNKVIMLSMALPMTLTAASAFASPGPKGGSCGFDDGQRGMMRELNLTAEQRQQMRDLRRIERDAMRDAMEAKRDEMRANHDAMAKLMLAPTFDEQQAQALAKKMVDERVAQRVEMMKNHYKMMSILTPEQKAKFTELMDKGPMDQQCDRDMPRHHGDDDRRGKGQGPRD